MGRVAHNFEDLTGSVFGRLTVASRAENSRTGMTRWLCACTCGGQATVQAGNLRSGATKSCGCLKVERNKRVFTIYDGVECAFDACTQRPFTRGWCKPHYERVRGIERRGLTLAQYREMLEGQDHRCLVCERPFGSGQAGTPHIDHDHSCCEGRFGCGKCVRGLLCGNCNTGIGGLGESVPTLRRAIAYLEAA